jgi:hypothetical protein
VNHHRTDEEAEQDKVVEDPFEVIAERQICSELLVQILTQQVYKQKLARTHAQSLSGELGSL